MAYINPQTQSLKVCFQSRYSLPYFQREYKWESRHYEEMFNDIQRAFLEAYEPQHGRKEVADYPPYFLGSIITSSEREGLKPLIDGQQRITSTFLLLACLERFRRTNSVENAIDLTNLLGSVSFGSTSYAIEFPNSRKLLFDRYLDFAKTDVEGLTEAEDVDGLDAGDHKILDAIRATALLLDSTVKGVMAHFIDYVTEKVLLIDISVTSEAEAHRVFVTMNDRGLRLGPIELLKGNILSKIPDATEAKLCHEAWVKTMNDLRDIDPEEDSLFFRNFLRARFADTIRGKNKGDVAGDFDIVGDAYHRWFESNVSKLSIATSDDYAHFARVVLPKYADVYKFIRSAEESQAAGFECIYFNAIRKYTFQPMVLLASVNVDDTTDEWKAKLSLISRLIDLILTTRMIEGKENNYDTLKEPSFVLTKESRGKTNAQVTAYVRAEWSKYLPAMDKLSDMRYAKSERSDLLYILARIADYLEVAFELTSRVKFSGYWQRDRGGRTFDIEHLFREKFDLAALPAQHGFTDDKEYGEMRNRLGALTLLPRSRNRSLQDKPYRDKLAVYATEGVLAQTLCNAFYLNHPKVNAFTAANPTMSVSAISDFTKADISVRADLYEAIAKEIWKTP